MLSDDHQINEEALKRILAVKNNIDLTIWENIRNKFEGDIETQKEGIRDFFKFYSQIPYEANDFLIEFINSDINIEVLRYLARQYADLETLLPVAFEIELTSILRDVNDEEIQSLIKIKIKKIDESFLQFWKML